MIAKEPEIKLRECPFCPAPRTGEPISCAVCEGSWGGAVRLPALQESVKRQMAEVGGHVR